MKSSNDLIVPQRPVLIRIVGMPSRAGQLDLVERLLDVGPPEVGVGVDEPLVGREAHQGQAQRVGLALDLLDRGGATRPPSGRGGSRRRRSPSRRPCRCSRRCRAARPGTARTSRSTRRSSCPGEASTPMGRLLLPHGRPAQPDRRGPGQAEESPPIRHHHFIRLLDLGIDRVQASPRRGPGASPRSARSESRRRSPGRDDLRPGSDSLAGLSPGWPERLRSCFSGSPAFKGQTEKAGHFLQPTARAMGQMCISILRERSGSWDLRG